jgi:hypothetical protein
MSLPTCGIIDYQIKAIFGKTGTRELAGPRFTVCNPPPGHHRACR